MKLVEKHIITKSHPYFKEIDAISFLSKNLYNSVLYYVRQEYFSTKKYVNYNTTQKHFQDTKNIDYYALPTKVAQHVLQQVDQDFSNFFLALKEYKTHPNKFKTCPKIPHYKNKTKGRNCLTYTKQAVSFVKRGFVKLSKTNIKISINHSKEDICQVSINKITGGYCINIIYNKTETDLKLDKTNIASIDFGLCNLAAITFNQKLNPILIKGGVLKSINHYFNRKLAKFKSINKNANGLHLKRNNKIKDYLHKTSRYIINHLVSKNIGTLIIGHNKNQKQEINIGKRNNQNFVSVPFYIFTNMLKYKASLVGIDVKEITEEYTSKCSFFDNETICKHDVYLGRRVKRGLFKTSSGKIINADINGSYNIMKKAISNCFKKTNEIQDVIPVVHPIRVKSYKNGFMEKIL